MRAFTALAVAMAKGFVRDRMTVFFTILFPIFFIVIFGFVFAGGGSARQTVITVGSVPVIDQLPADARAGIDGVLELRHSDDLDAALEQVRSGDAAAAVQQHGNTIELHYSQTDQVAAGTVRGVFGSLVDSANLAATGQPPTYSITSTQVEDTSLKAIQFIAPGMIAYGVAVGATFGAAMTLISWRDKRVMRRLQLAPVSTWSVVLSRVVVSLVVALVQLAIFIGVSMVPGLGLKLTSSWWMSIPLVLAGTLSFLAIGLFVGAVCKTAEGGSGLANLITLPMSFLSGAFIPLQVAPAWISVAAKVLPLGYLVAGLQDVMVRGQGPSAALLPIGILLAFTVVVTAISTKLFRWDAV
jgi:ABC-2 type transport system permease protein